MREFEKDELRNIERLQERLRKSEFKFAAQKAVAVKKSPDSDARRPLVVAPIENRVVQRAILDVAQEQIPAVVQVLGTPTSIGGIPKRGVGHALALIEAEIKNGARYFVRSDISGFFTKIPRAQIVEFINEASQEREYTELFEAAITTELSNIGQPGIFEHKDIFPIGPTGVAQGSPLSPLVGNILLKEFDESLNDRGIRCIRYIDDFILLGKKRKNVMASFESARKLLAEFDMVAYGPDEDNAKAECGLLTDGFVFLGYQISPGLVMPSKPARQKIEARVANILASAKGDLKKVALGQSEDLPKFRYSHTLKYLNDVIKGWGYAFQFTNSKQCMRQLDDKIDDELTSFNAFVKSLVSGLDAQTTRRVLGVYLLEDVKTKNLPEL